MKKILQDYNLTQLTALCLAMGEKPFRAKQLYLALMQGKKISQISVLSAVFKQKLLEEYEDEPVAIIQTLRSQDGTEKYLFRLADGNVIEGVFMRYKHGNTQCVSTQVGCRMGCKFCASTLGGLVRNLTAGEILCQVLTVNALHGGDTKNRAVTNVVLMGSGEPLDNYDSVLGFLYNVSEEGGICISPRNISLSTCGLVPKMYDLADTGLPIVLTVSLHNVTDGERARTMPVANKYTIAEILQACRYTFEKTGRRYVFEYALIEGENCDEQHAKALINLLKGLPCLVNCIRLNEVKERKLLAATELNATRFVQALNKGGLTATLRRRVGADIGGACGQLRVNYLKQTQE